VFDIQEAQQRLVAAERARQLLTAAIDVLAEANVTNPKVTKAVVKCCKELSDYRHVTMFTINKRRERAKEHRR
jgi:hypothetical protein